MPLLNLIVQGSFYVKCFFLINWCEDRTSLTVLSLLQAKETSTLVCLDSVEI